MGRILSYNTDVGAARQAALNDAVDTIGRIDSISRRNQEAWVQEQRVNLAYAEANRAQLQMEREAVREQNAAMAYQFAADALAQINPDDPTAEAAVSKWKGVAGQHLDSAAMNELFGPMERNLEFNRRQLGVLREKTGIGNPIVNQSTGLIDWDATWEAGQRNLDELRVRTEKWGDDSRFLFHNLRDMGHSEYSAMAAADRSDSARKLFEEYQQAALEAGITAPVSNEDWGNIRKSLFPNTVSVNAAGSISATDQNSVNVIASGNRPQTLYGPGMGQYVYDYDEVQRWTANLPPEVHKVVRDKATAPARAADLWERKQAADIQQTQAQTRLTTANATAQEMTNATAQMEAAEEAGTAADGGQPKFNFE